MELAVPVLPSRDLEETRTFYEALGFESRGGDHRDQDYLMMARGDVWLHFTLQPEVDPLSTASACYVYVDDADALHAAWDGRVQPDPASGSRLAAPATRGYGMREFAVVDRSGNLLRVGSAVR